MKPYITFRETDDNGELQYYILQRAFPHYMGVIKASPQDSLINAAIPGYYLWVCFCGSLRGNMIPAFKGLRDELAAVYMDMASWYFTNRVEPNEKKYKKFKIKTDVPSSHQ